MEPRFPWAPNESPAASRWEYSVGVGPAHSREERESFRHALAAALQVARGAGVAFALRTESGPRPALYLLAGTGEARRWVHRALLPAYPRRAWRGAHMGSTDEIRAFFWARRLRAWPSPLRVDPDGPSILDAWSVALASLPVGFALEIGFTPLPAREAGLWDRLLVASVSASVPAGEPARGTIVRGPRLRADGPAPTERPAGWRAVVRFGTFRPRVTASRVREAARAIGRASINDQGNGLTFGPGVWERFGLGREFLVAESELEGFLPSIEPLVTYSDTSTPPHGMCLPLGRTDWGLVVGPELDPHQGRHLAILGETGMGKSSLLVAIARRVSREHGLILLDPLGSTASALEAELPDSARSRVLRIAPIGSPVRINALEGAAALRPEDAVKAERRLNDLVHALRRVRAGRYVESAYWGPRLEEMLTRALEAAAAWPGATLADAHTLLATGGRLHREIPPTALGPVRELSHRIHEHPDDAEGARRLLHEVVRSRVLGSMLAAEDPDLSLSDLVLPGRVVVVSGDAREVGESTARYLLSVYLALVWSEILSRPTRTKMFLVLDEAQWFAHEGLAEMLRLGRFVNLHVVFATQSIAVLPTAVAEAVWTNVADFVAFRGSPEVARELARASRDVSTERILSLARGEAAVLLGKGHSVHWLRTLRLPTRTATASGRRDGFESAQPPDPPNTLQVEPVDAFGSSSDRLGTPLSASGSERPGEKPADGSCDRAATPEDVIEFLQKEVASAGKVGPFSIPLAELRRRVDPCGIAVRHAGARLSRAGALLAIERTAHGTVWTLEPERIGTVREGPRNGSARAEVPESS